MTKLSGIYAASMSVINSDLSLNVEKTIVHAEKLIDQGCHGTAIFGSTGQAQLIPIAEKIKLLNSLSDNKYKNKYLIGTGLNSLNETINFLKISASLNFKQFLIMPPAYYKYEDKDVVNFYTKIVESAPESKIVLYNFEKLCGYKFSLECIEELVKRFPNNIIGVKDSSYNLFEKLKIDNFSIMPGSESKLLRGLEIGCDGIITATCNVTAQLARRVYDDFFSGKIQNYNQKLIDVRSEFEKYNLISALHTFKSDQDEIYRNILPPLGILNDNDQKSLMKNLKKLDFQINSKLAA
ncbi:dihydrodipicolinate synthase family protein [Candidatus Pelagibacter sp.]|nr:dihydrodipicolinate synthase family protein [Candidatus Pelagibacter sp.]